MKTPCKFLVAVYFGMKMHFYLVFYGPPLNWKGDVT